MASPRRRRLRKALRAGLLKTAQPVKAPAPLVDAPVVEEVEEVKEEAPAPKKAKKAPKKK
jgi:hypothetical protein